MTADERAMLAAVVADPDADLLRLVYADWLDDHGRPERAEFIRLQCELRHATATPVDAVRANSLILRLRAVIPDPRADGPSDFGGAVVWDDYRRGFPTQVTIQPYPTTLAAPLIDVFSLAPLLSAEVWDAKRINWKS